MKANVATSLIAYARGGVRKQLLVLCLLTLCVGNMWGGAASWIGKSYIVVNGTWYNADGTGQSNNFDGYNLGHLTSLTLGGEVQTYGQSDGYNNSATMGYQISGQSESSMTLYWYQDKENNNWFHSASGKSSDFAANTINISGLTPGEYTLSVWFYQADGGVYDSNSSNNYVATFYIDPTITFDQQSGTGGTSSITGTWGAAMPSIKLPSRAGKKFEGYYTGQNGTGTQYYAYNGNSVHTCDFTSNPTLYANWKTPTEYTFYYAAPSDIVADNTVKCYVNYGYDQGSADVNMTATNMTYNNKRIYSVTVTANYQSFDGIYFKPKGWSGDGSEEQAANTSYVAASEINGKIYEHGVGWQTYAKDASYTVYYVNTNNWTTPKAYAWSSDYDKSVADYASSAAMTKTDYTYNGHDIYTITYTRGFTNVIFNDNASESAKTGNLECYANRGKLYNGSTWQAFGRDITFYAVPESMDGSKWDEGSHTLYADIKYGDSEWKKVQMTKSAYDYNGNPIYTCMTLIPYNVIKQIKFYYNDGSDHDLYDCNPGTQYGTNDLDGKILLGWNGSHNWVSYGRDVTVYTVPEYLFRGYPIKFSEDEHYPSVCVQYGVGDGEWKTINMVKTDYTYDNYPIWKATFLLDYNIFKEFQIKYFDKANRKQLGLYAYNQGGNQEYPSSNLDDKLYHGWNGGEDHDFFSYRYDVALDMQSGGGGSTSIIAIDGSAMPSAKMPGRDGYAFGGYWTETNGGGTQYYNADGSSTRNWDSRTITTLYAHWTPKSYTVILEGMEADSNDSVLVNVTYDAVLPELETKHTKAHYDLLGYWAASDDNGMNKTKQLIEANGKWIPDVAGYTGNDGEGNPTWKRDGIDISLFADWTEHPYTVTTSVSPAGAGTLSCGSSVTAKWVTLSEPITATASIGYSFREWDFSKTGEDHDVYSDSTEGYTSLSNPIRIRAQHDGTLTAKFTEIPTHITITKIGGGEVQINGEDKESTSVGVTTTRTLTAVAAAGYTFSGWTLPENADFEVIEGDVKNPTITLRGKGAGDAGEIVATFTECWVLSAQSEGWGRAEFTIANITVEDGKAIGYADIALPANTNLQFKVVDKSTSSEYKNGVDQVYYMTYGNSQNWLFTTAKTYNCGITTAGRGVYRFNWNFTDKTMTVVYPTAHQLELGWRYTLIDTPNKLNEGDTGGTVTATSSGFSIKDKEYIADGEELQLMANAKTGYSFDNNWYDNNDCQNSFMSGNPTQTTVTSHFRVYAKFAEIPTPITITKIGGGEVQINGEDKESTSVGVTTTRELTAVPNEGYKFSHWTLPDNADFEIEAGNVDNPTITLRGKGAGDAGEIVATFTECWVLSAESEGWGSAEFTIANIEVEDGKAIGYADIALPANRKLQFKMVDKSTSSEYKNGVDQVYYMTYGNSQNWLFTTAKTYNCGITTAGRGVYRFNWNFTDKTMTVVYPESYKVNYGAAVGGSVTSVLDDDKKVVPNGGYVRKGGSVTYEATASDGYTFTGWCPDDSYGDTFTNRNPWENSNVTATSNAYAKFHSTNFVIYRSTDDMESDPRAVWDDVKSYEGGTISETIEFRMKVNKLDYWYTLCLPFEVNAVKVWDDEDGAYYDIVPYWRTEGTEGTEGTYYTGHYILRKPVTTTNFAIEGFEGKDRWIDPESSDVLPSKNIPYIIQWHDTYFQDMYISFFGRADQIIPTAMDNGSYASSDETVNIYGNNSMNTGTVRDAYLLDPYYGSDGAWMREEIGTYRSVLPFECFILANPTTTAKYRVLRRDMADDTPTGLDTLSKTEDTVSKVLINNRIYIIRGGKMYTLQGTLVKEVE